VLDNRRCISYLTIELRGPIPRELRPLIGQWVFGCDICQDVCPVNRKAAITDDPAFQPRTDVPTPKLVDLLQLDVETFREKFRNSPVKRAKLSGLKRNACVALGNAGDVSSSAALARALTEEDALVRGHAAWALGRIGGREAQTALECALRSETDEGVREEIASALDELTSAARF
jgi:epoxyqueuosine reductase